MAIPTYDITVVGGGIVGLSTAWQLQAKYPNKSILLVEKEDALGTHQTGHNSGVIHAGVYYQPGSLKAKFCKLGSIAIKAFCREHNIAFDECGKLLVATTAVELQRMAILVERCQQNNIDIDVLNQTQLQEREPNIKGLGAIYVAATGIVDYRAICHKLSEIFQQAGGVIYTNTKVIALEERADSIVVESVSTLPENKRLQTRFLVACTGLMADRTTKMLGIDTDFQIIPFRGEYYQLPIKHQSLINHLIYPIPDPDLPFLGVHLTRMIDGSVTVGPNAVQGWKREGYGKINLSIRDILDMLLFVGFWKLLKQHWRVGLKETCNSWCKVGYLQEVRKYCDKVTKEDLLAYPAGIRAQAVMKDGSLVHDFLFVETLRSLHVCNAPSPAATSAFPIGEHIVGKLDVLMSNINHNKEP